MDITQRHITTNNSRKNRHRIVDTRQEQDGDEWQQVSDFQGLKASVVPMLELQDGGRRRVMNSRKKKEDGYSEEMERYRLASARNGEEKKLQEEEEEEQGNSINQTPSLASLSITVEEEDEEMAFPGLVEIVLMVTKPKDSRNHVDIINQALDNANIEDQHVERFVTPSCDRLSHDFNKLRCEKPYFLWAWFQELQELAACIQLGYEWDDFVQVRKRALLLLDSQEQDEEEMSYVAAAMESSDLGLSSHLICHACEGYYLPAKGGCELETPLYDATGSARGGWIGSSDHLLSELVDLCPVLGLDLRPLKGAVRRGGGFDISEHTIEKLRSCTKSTFENHDRPFDDRNAESMISTRLCHTWFVLYEAARLSSWMGSMLLLQT